VSQNKNSIHIHEEKDETVTITDGNITVKEEVKEITDTDIPVDEDFYPPFDVDSDMGG